MSTAIKRIANIPDREVDAEFENLLKQVPHREDVINKENIGDYLPEVPIILTAVKPEDETKNSDTTYADDSYLKLEFPESGVYSFEGCILHNEHATPSMKIRFSADTGISIYWQTDLDDLNANPITGTTAITTTGDGADAICFIKGIIIASGLGTLALQWAQNTSDVNDTILKKGSWLKAIKL